MNLQQKIEETRIAKDNIKLALRSKGQLVSDDISTYAEAISNIEIVNNTNLTVNPSVFVQNMYPLEGYTGFDEVIVNPVTSNIDPNIIPSAIKNGITILGITGNVVSLNGQTKSITENGTYTPTNGANGITEVQVQVGAIGIPREISNTGVYQISNDVTHFSLPSHAHNVGAYALYRSFEEQSSIVSTDLSSLTTLSGDYALYRAFYGCTSLTSVDLSSLTTVSGSGLYSAFSGCSSLTSVDLSSLTTVSGSNAFRFAFNSCSNLTSVDLRSLTTVSGSSGLFAAFANCTSLTSVDLSPLTTVSGTSALELAFNSCSNLTSIDLSSLTTVSGSSGMYRTFYGCTSLQSLSFPALTADSFGSYTNQFNNMLQGVSGCTVHFPSNLQSVIGSWSDVTNGFGGTNTTVLFDLPSTGPVTLTVKIKDDYCSYINLNGESKSKGRGTYTYEYPYGTVVTYSYSHSAEGTHSGTITMDQNRELSIGYSGIY